MAFKELPETLSVGNEASKYVVNLAFIRVHKHAPLHGSLASVSPKKSL